MTDEEKLDLLDPEWRIRFGGDAEAAARHYRTHAPARRASHAGASGHAVIATKCTMCPMHGTKPAHVAVLRAFTYEPHELELCWCCWFRYAFEITPIVHKGGKRSLRGPADDARFVACEAASLLPSYESYVRGDAYEREVVRRRIEAMWANWPLRGTPR